MPHWLTERFADSSLERDYEGAWRRSMARPVRIGLLSFLRLYVLGLAATVALASACTVPATEFLVAVDTDLPPSLMVSLTATVLATDGRSGLVRLGSRGPDGGVRLPATFGVTPGETARDGTVRLTVTATIAPSVPMGPSLTLVRQVFLTFTPGRTQTARVFLSRLCSVVVAGCRSTPPGECTLSARCQESGLTCNDTGQCVAPPRVVPPTADASMDACTPSCQSRHCGDDGCHGVCGTCASPQVCDSFGGQCVAPCGALDAACCAGNICSDPGTRCSGGRCVTACGRLGEPCCSAGTCTASGARCSAGTCVTACGRLGEPCCVGSTCSESGTECSSGRCVASVACGLTGQPCCSGSCTESGTVCQNLTCATCGNATQPCCTGSQCGSFSTCVGSTCEACGFAGQPCCLTGSQCASSAYCNGGTCWSLPVFTEASADGPGCADFAIAHPLFQWTVVGRPGARGEKHARHVSCAGSVDFVTSDGCFTLGADGRHAGLPSNPVITDCTLADYGGWESYVIVDGQRTPTQTGAFYNSGCPGLATCAEAASFCPSGPPVTGPSSCP